VIAFSGTAGIRLIFQGFSRDRIFRDLALQGGKNRVRVWARMFAFFLQLTTKRSKHDAVRGGRVTQTAQYLRTVSGGELASRLVTSSMLPHRR